MADDQPIRPALPMPTVAMLAAMGPPDLMFPPAQSILPGAKSYMNYPFALVAGHRMLRLDLHIPEGVRGPVPVVLYASGGAWRIVLKGHGPWRFLLQHGYAVASMEYRLSEEARFPAGVHDVKAAIRWLRANAAKFSLDGARIAAWGSSAGAYLSAMAAATNGMPDFEGDVGEDLGQSSEIACLIDHYGPSDLSAMAEDTNGIPGAMEIFGTETSPESLLLGYRPADRPEDARRAAVACYISAATVPFLIMHGDADTRLGIGQSERLRRELLRVGADVEYHVVPGANHAGPEFDTSEAQQIALDFLHRAFRPGAPLRRAGPSRGSP